MTFDSDNPSALKSVFSALMTLTVINTLCCDPCQALCKVEGTFIAVYMPILLKLLPKITIFFQLPWWIYPSFLIFIPLWWRDCLHENLVCYITPREKEILEHLQIHNTELINNASVAKGYRQN